MMRPEDTSSTRLSTTETPDIAASGSGPASTVLNSTLVPPNVTGIGRCPDVPTRLTGFIGSIAIPTLAAADLGAISPGGDQFGRERLFVWSLVRAAKRK